MSTNAVDEYLAGLQHPFTAEVQTIREIVLGANPAIAERIKWKSPSFYSGRDDLGAFELRPRDFVRLVLVFPHGLVDDPTGLMLGDWRTGANSASPARTTSPQNARLSKTS